MSDQINTLEDVRTWLRDNRPKPGMDALSAEFWATLFDIIDLLAADLQLLANHGHEATF